MSAASSVYVLKSDHGLIKVGISKDPEKRLKGIRANSGLVIDLAHARELENAAAVEHAAHVILNTKRRGGEWFDITVEEAVSAIDAAIEGLARSERFRLEGPAGRPRKYLFRPNNSELLAAC
jgi:T5orf172 domain